MKYKVPVVLMVVLLFAFTAQAQTQAPVHQHPADNVVDGSQTPDAIPDSVAYRLWLITVSPAPDATEKQRAFHKAHLKKLPLNLVDGLTLDLILSDFKRDYLDLIAKHNKQQRDQLAHGVLTVDDAKFLQQRDDLVSSTRVAIQQKLSLDGAVAVDGHVKNEKIHMQLHQSGGQQ